MRTRFETLAADTARRAADLAAWTSQLVESATDHGQAVVLDLPGAVEWVFGVFTPDDEDLIKAFDSATLERLARDYYPAEAELLECTAGQPFRLEGPSGPLFIASALWDFSGGRELEAGEMPAWDGDGAEVAA